MTDRDAGAAKPEKGTGVIELRFETERSGVGYRYELDAAKVMTATKSGGAADMINRVMAMENKKVYELGIPVRVMLRTEGMMPGGRSWYAFWIYSRNRYTRKHYHEPAWRAWNNMPWDPIDAISTLSG